MTKALCKTCAYFQRPPVGRNIDLRNLSPGECHIGPPQVHILSLPDGKGTVGLQNISVWPPKMDGDWCGRHPDFKH